MTRIYIGMLCIVVLFSGCIDNHTENQSIDNRVYYSKELQYDPDDSRYIGSPELEVKNRDWSKPSDFKFDAEVAGLPIATFAKAFDFAYKALGEYYTYELIDGQLPFVMNIKDGVWIVKGALPQATQPDSAVVGGNAEIAFERDSGRILYIYHSL